MKNFKYFALILPFFLLSCEGLNINLDLSSGNMSATGKAKTETTSKTHSKTTNRGQIKKSQKYGPLGIPKGHLPKAGQCRIWHPGVPPGRQSKSGPCHVLARQVPVGAWLITGPIGRKHKTVDVSVYDEQKAGVVLEIRRYNGETGAFLSIRN